MKRYLPRHNGLTRFNHWILVILFFMAGFSGLSLFHPNLFPLTAIFGGPQWTRIVHPYFGIATFIAFLFMVGHVWRDNLLVKSDLQWMEHSVDMLEGKTTAMPPVGKYNAGQKGVFWGTMLCLIGLLLTGVLFWQPWFGDVVPIPVQRAAVLVHSFCAFIVSLVIFMHVYAAFWVKGTLRGMIQGTVSAGWAKQNHYLWYKKIIREESAEKP